MPTYNYECQKCGHNFEIFQNMSDASLKKCPVCKKGKVIRIISGGAGVIFKGTGFYTTDYKKNSNKKIFDSEKKDKPKSDLPESNKTEEKKSDAA